MTVIGPRSSCDAKSRKSVFAFSRATIRPVSKTRSRPAVILTAKPRRREISHWPNSGVNGPARIVIMPWP